jgi:hypothetical protein
MKKQLPLILGFTPLIVFSLLSKLLPSGDIGVAGLVAALLALVAMGISRPVWPPKILNVCSFVLFGLIAALGFTLGQRDDSWLATWTGAGVGIVIGAVILLLVPIMPFTEQYARAQVPRQDWGSPTFKRINHALSLAWGVAIMAIGASRTVAEVVHRHGSGRVLPQLLLGAAVPIVIVVYMLKFTQSYPQRVAHSPAQRQAAGPTN